MTSYVAVAPVVIVSRTSGATSTIYRGDPVPSDATSAAITHLLALSYIAEGGSAPPVTSNVIPTPSSGDAGKVPTVNEAEDGYELDAPSGGGLAITLPTGTHGVQQGLIGLEYNGAPVALGSVPFDTVYLDPAATASDDLTDPVVGDFATFTTAGLTDLAAGLYQIVATLVLEDPLDAAGKLQISGPLGGSLTLPVAAGVDEIQIPLTTPIVAGKNVAVSFVPGAGETAQLGYAVLGITQLAPLA